MTLDTILAERKPGKFIFDLSGFVTNPDLGGVIPKDLEQAPLMVREMISLRAFDLTIGNSGIYKWLVELYADHSTLSKLFDKIRAEKAAKYIESAIDLFPQRRVPKDLDKRLDFCEAHDADLYQLDRQFEGASEEAITKFREYLMENRDIFECEVQKFWETRKANKRCRHGK